MNEKNVAIFYVSNRSSTLLDPTIKNLKKLGFPQVDKSHVYLMKGMNNKGARRKEIEKNFDIVALFGDNLGDFADVFNGVDYPERNSIVDQWRDQFGSKLIVFPNPLYGDWEWIFYQYNLIMDDHEKAKIREKALVPFDPK